MDVSIIGAMGAVGSELVRLLSLSSLSISSLKLFTRQDTTHQKVSFKDQDVTVFPLDSIEDAYADLVFLVIDSKFSKEYAHILLKQGACVIDMSDAFRMDPKVPLIIPEVNGHVLQKSDRLIANPNCTTALAAVSLEPLTRITTIRSVYLSTYQAASGAGIKGMNSLSEEIEAYHTKVPYAPSVFPHPLHLNLIPKISDVNSFGVSREEQKVIDELKKIFNSPEWRIGCTAVRVPTMRCHAASVLVACNEPVDMDQWRTEILTSPALRLKDMPDREVYPMPLTATGMSSVEVGRLRYSSFLEPYGVEYFIVGDQLLKGAAFNALQIAEAYFYDAH